MGRYIYMMELWIVCYQQVAICFSQYHKGNAEPLGSTPWWWFNDPPSLKFSLVNYNLIFGSWGPTRTCFTLHWCAAIFEMFVPLLYRGGVHCFIPKGLLNFVGRICLEIGKIYIKFNAIVLFKFFYHFSKNKIWWRSLTLPLLSEVYQRLTASAGSKNFKQVH